MTRKAGFILIALCLLTLLAPSPVAAQSPITVGNSAVEVHFPLTIRFTLEVESTVNITDIRLNYIVEQTGLVRVVSEANAVFTPQTAVTTDWTWDMRKTGGLPPGVAIDYWWLVKDAAGNTLETAPQRINFDDTRYSWENLTEGEVTIYWYQGNSSFARELMSAAQQALTWLAANTGAHLEKDVRLYIYASRDLLGAMVFPQEWTGGVAYSRYGTIVIGIDPVNIAWGKRAVAHELTHLVIHQLVFGPYSSIPTWLDEGLAMGTEGELQSSFQSYLDSAIKDDELISVRSLSSPFSADPQLSYLSYAQSYSLVDFLISEYGQESMLQLLNTLKENSYDEALMTVYGFDIDGLDSQWRHYITEVKPYEKTSSITPLMVGVIVALAVILIATGVLVALNYTRRRRH